MKRSFIITLALIAAIAVQLCASSGWARGLGVLGLTGGGGEGTPAPFLKATFTPLSDGEMLADYVPEIGSQTWTRYLYHNLELSTGSLKKTGNSDPHLVVNTGTTAPSADYSVKASGNCRSTSIDRIWGVVARWTSDTGNYSAQIVGNVNFGLYKGNTLVAPAVVISNTPPHEIVLNVNGSVITATETVTNTTITYDDPAPLNSPGSAGVFLRQMEPRIYEVEAWVH